MNELIVLQGTENHNRGQIILCSSFSDVWSLQNYKPTGYEGLEALKIWCRVKGYQYTHIGLPNKFPITIN